MNKSTNPVWSFFASVKLALFTLFFLAVTSIIGTLIPQNKPFEYYMEQYGAGTANLFRLLNVPDMYNAWWFLLLLALLSMNLIICSLDRLPNVLRLINMDNLAIDLDRLRKMALRKRFVSSGSVNGVADQVAEEMAAAGWKTGRRSQDNGDIVLFAQKGALTRLGVYVVHVSILIVFIGAIIGSLFGSKGSVMLPEMSTTDKIYQNDDDHSQLPLGFQVRCDRFDLTYYDTGAPKEYRSDLVVIENGTEVLKKSIVVNDPLQYKGWTFYQSSYNALDDFLITLRNQTTNAEQTLRVPPKRKVLWQEEGVELGITNLQGPNRWGEYRIKIWLSDGKGTPSTFWLDKATTAKVERPETKYLVSSKQFFATGLQVAKDPGVWPVYIGCTMMLLGLIVAFFMSHKRLWVHVGRDEEQTRVLVAGAASKNKVGFENQFEALLERLEAKETLQLTRD